MFIVSKRSFVVHVIVLLLCVFVTVYTSVRILAGPTTYDIAMMVVSGILTTMVFAFGIPTIKSLLIHYRAMRGRKVELREFLRAKHRLINLLHTVPVTPTIGENMSTAGLFKDEGERLLIMRRSYGLECVIVDDIGTKLVNGEVVDVQILKGFTIPYSDYLPVMVRTLGNERKTDSKRNLDEVRYARHAGDQLREVINRLIGNGKPTPMAANSLNTATIDDMRELLEFMPEYM